MSEHHRRKADHRESHLPPPPPDACCRYDPKEIAQLRRDVVLYRTQTKEQSVKLKAMNTLEADLRKMTADYEALQEQLLEKDSLLREIERSVLLLGRAPSWGRHGPKMCRLRIDCGRHVWVMQGQVDDGGAGGIAGAQVRVHGAGAGAECRQRAGCTAEVQGACGGSDRSARPDSPTDTALGRG